MSDDELFKTLSSLMMKCHKTSHTVGIMYNGLQEIECEGKELSEVLMELNALATMSSKTTSSL